MKKIISCDVHDHFEIACMRQSEVSLKLHNGQIITGRAKDLVTENKVEYVCLEITDQEQHERINLIDINTLTIKGSDSPIMISKNGCSLR